VSNFHCMFLSRLLVGALLISGAKVGFAQALPAPAPIPQKPAPKPTATPAPTPAPTPLILENPAPNDEPIIIGEPVRNQTVLKPTKPTAKPTPKATAKPAKKVSVAGVDISNLADGVAVAKLKAALEPRLKDPIRLVIGDYQYTFTRAELGASIPYWPLMREARAAGSVGLRLQVDEVALEKMLRELDVIVREDFEKIALNIGGSKVRVAAALKSVPPKSSCELLTTTVATVPTPTPTPSAEQTSTPKTGSGKFPYLLSSFSTRYDASLRGRTTNLKMAATNINGAIVAPGKVFSTNNAIGPRNAASGWREAKMFVSGRVVSGTGAGICQASSTIYNAVLRANFPVVERHAHSMRVTYVPPSLDAALMWGSKDFKFRNDSATPVKVETKVSGGQFHVNIWGQKPRNLPKVAVTSKVISRGKGMTSEAYKVVGGKSVRLSRDFYKPQP
jgi:vancomycin resistance protein YoaR